MARTTAAATTPSYKVALTSAADAPALAVILLPCRRSLRNADRLARSPRSIAEFLSMPNAMDIGFSFPTYIYILAERGAVE
jgi:hypothetical protein